MTDVASNEVEARLEKQRVEAQARYQRSAGQAAHAAEKDVQERRETIERARRRLVPGLTPDEANADLTELNARTPREVSALELHTAMGRGAEARAEYEAALAHEAECAEAVHKAELMVAECPPGDRVGATVRLSQAHTTHDSAVYRVRTAGAQLEQAKQQLRVARDNDAKALAAIANK